jgi:hypothetical protein
MAALVAAIHVEGLANADACCSGVTWMPGARPGMTRREWG